MTVGLGSDASGDTAGVLELGAKEPVEGIAALSRVQFHAVSDEAVATYTNGRLASVTAPQCQAIITELPAPNTNAGFIVNIHMRADSSASFETNSERVLVVAQGLWDESIAVEWASGDFTDSGDLGGETVYVYELCAGTVVKVTTVGPPPVPQKGAAVPGNTPACASHLVKMAKDSVVRRYPAESEAKLPLPAGKTEPTALTMLSSFDYSGWELSVANVHGTIYRDYTREVEGATFTVWRSTFADWYSEAELTVDTFVDQTWGWALMRSETGLSESSDYEYYTNTTDNGYGKLKKVLHSDGRWERYEYNAAGALHKMITPFGDVLPDADESLCRVRTTTSEQSGAEVTTTDIEAVLGVEVARSYTVRSSMQTRFVQCVSAGAAIDASGNRVTITTYVQNPVDDNPFTGMRVSRIEHPDGTLTLRTYPGEQVETEWHGEPNSGGTAVVDGTRTDIQKNDFGQVVMREVYDIASSVLIDSETAIDFDSTGRPVEWRYLDGTTRRIVPGCCCGIESETARDGSTRFYEYDPEGRPVLTTYANAVGTSVVERAIYDAAGRLLLRGYVDSEGMTLSPTDEYFHNHFSLREGFEYDLAGRTLTSMNAAWGETIYSAPYANGLHQVKDTTYPDDGTMAEEFYLDGQLYRRTGTAVPHVQMEYGVENGELYAKEIALGDNEETTQWSKAYTDFLGRRYKTTFADGSFQQSWFNAQGQTVKSVDRDGVVTLFAYNGKGEREVVALDRTGNDVIDYAGLDRIAKTVTGVVTAHSTNVWRTVTQVWDQDNADAPRTNEIRDVSVDGLQTWTTLDGQETHTVTAYVPAQTNRIDTTTYPDLTQLITTTVNGQMSYQEWKDKNGATVRTIDPVYGTYGRLIQRLDSQQGATTFSYDWYGLLVAKTQHSCIDSNDTLVESYEYDDSMRMTSVTKSDNSVTHTEYAPNGQISKQWGSGVYPVEYQYDVQARPSAMYTWQNFAASSGVATTMWLYHPTNGTLARKQYNDGKGVNYTSTPGGRPKTRTWERGVTTEYAFNSFGELTNVHYSASDTPDVAYTRDRLGRVKTASSASAAYAYGYTGSLLTSETVTRGDGSNTLVRTYDALNRPSGYQLDSATPVTYGFDDAGRLARVGFVGLTNVYNFGPNGLLSGAGISGHVTVARGYDGFNRLVALTNSTPGGLVSSYAYTHDALGRRTSMGMASGEPGNAGTWNYQYDSLGQLSNAWKTANGTIVPGRQYGYQHDDIGNRIKTVRGNNVSDLVLNPTPEVTSEYTANLVNQYEQRTIPAYAEVSGTGRVDAVLSFQNLATGDRIRAGRNGTWFHTYMPLSGNTAGTVTNLVRMTGVLAGQGTNGVDLINTNQTLTLGVMKTPQVFTHDDDGNLLNDGAFTYTWDGENRLVLASNATTVVSNSYDYLSRRIAKTVFTNNAGTWALSSMSTFVYDGWNLISDVATAVSGGSSVTNRYVWGLDLFSTLQDAGGVGGLVSMSRVGASSNTYFYCMDGNGNVMAMVDASGTAVAENEYNPFGECIKVTGAVAAANPWRFSTRYYDRETGLVMYPRRPHSPILGRFLCKDPIEEQGGWNLYAFVGNDPIDQIDPLGLSWVITRDKNQNWAVAKPETASDTFESLATQLRLEHAERTKWLKGPGQSATPVGDGDEAKPGCEYKVPNTVVVYTSQKAGVDRWYWDNLPSLANHFRGMAKAAGDNYAAKKYKVVYELERASESLFISLWQTDGIYAFAFGGHGSPSANTPGVWYGYVAAPGSESAVAPSQVVPPYRLQAVGAYNCGSANPIMDLGGAIPKGMRSIPTSQWRDHVSNNGGTFVSYIGGVGWGNVWWRQVSENAGYIPE